MLVNRRPPFRPALNPWPDVKSDILAAQLLVLVSLLPLSSMHRTPDFVPPLDQMEKFPSKDEWECVPLLDNVLSARGPPGEPSGMGYR